MLLIALAAGVAAVVLGAQWMRQQGAASGPRVAVARTEIQIGSRIVPELVDWIDWPNGSVPPGAFLDTKTLEGRVAKAGILRGEPILEGRLAPVGTSGGLSALVSPGHRAITVRVNDVVGVAGFALPGNYVDIIVNTQAGSGHTDADHAISKIVLERILVLAVAQEASRDETKPRVVNAVTLEVTPAQAEKIDLARSVGNLSLVLRNEVDPTPSETVGETKETLLGYTSVPKSTPAPAPAPAPRRPVVASAPAAPPVAAPNPESCIEVIRSGSKTYECFQ
jgi:pilus assembly protein CpaB